MPESVDPVVTLFSESHCRIVVTVPAQAFDALKTLAATHGTKCTLLGEVGGDSLCFGDLDVSLDELKEAYLPTLERLVHGG